MATLNGYEMSIYYSNIVTKYIKGKYRGGEKGCNSTNVKLMVLVKPSTKLLKNLNLELGFLSAILMDKYGKTEHIGVWRMCHNIQQSISKEVRLNVTLEYALKEYKVTDIQLVKAIKHHINKVNERVNRITKDVLPEYIEFAGLKSYYRLRENQGYSILEDLNLALDKFHEYKLDINEMENKDYYKIRLNVYKEHIESIMKENGIWYDNVDFVLHDMKIRANEVREKKRIEEEKKLKDKIEEELEICYINNVAPKFNAITERKCIPGINIDVINNVLFRVAECPDGEAYFCVLYRYNGGSRGMSYSYLSNIDTSTLDVVKTKSFKSAHMFNKTDRDIMIKIKNALERESNRVRVEFVRILV